MLKIKQNERAKKIRASAIAGLVARIISMLVSFLIISMSVSYLGSEYYGYWVAATSFLAVLSFADGGAGNAVINKIAATGRQDKSKLCVVVVSAYGVMLMFSTFGGGVLLLSSNYISWSDVLGGGGSLPKHEAQAVVIIAAGAFFVGGVTSLIYKIQRGMQSGVQENLWLGVTALVACCSVYLAKDRDLGILWYAVLVSFSPIFVQILATLCYFFIQRDINVNSVRCFDFSVAGNIVRGGGIFLILQVAAAVQGQMDNVLIANMLGPAAVTQYSVCMKLFLMPMVFYGLILNPMWPAYREALATKDYIWINKSFSKSIKVAIIFGFVCGSVLIGFSGIIIEKWVGYEQVPSYELRIGCGIWLLLSVVGGTMATFLNGMEIMRPQLKIALITTVANIIITMVLIPLIGVAGAVFGSVLAYIFFALAPSYILISNKIKLFKV